MAANDTTLTNSFGRADDWIELHNNSATTIDLGGWHLSDSATALAKWQIPPVLMPPDSYLLIWASGENTVANGELHASFRLSAGGEYLALVRPDGFTIEDEYAPVFPEQADDISYGVDLVFGGEDVVPVPEQSFCRILVPTGDPGPAWRDRIFDDSGWADGATGVGFESSGNSYTEEINTDVEAEMSGQMNSVYLRLPFAATDPAAFASLRLKMRFDDGFVAFINGVEIARSNAPSALTWNASATAARDDSEALFFSEFEITNTPASLLLAGTNVLAIHGLNSVAGATNLLIQPVLEATLKSGVTVRQQRYYSEPTPGAPNSDAFLGFVADTKFSVDRGFHSSPFNVEISCQPPGATVRYTLDGSTPSVVHGNLYSFPIPVNTTTILRAVAYKTGWRSSDVDTQTYIFVEDVLHQPEQPTGWPAVWTGGFKDYEMDPEVRDTLGYAGDIRSALTNIPTISLVTDMENLFGPVGIYDNTTLDGDDWERPVSAELIHPDGSPGFQVNCGIRIQGGGSRGATSTPKHSFRLAFKSLYGPSKLNFKLFPDSDVDSFDTIHLRATYNSSWTKLQSVQRARAQYNRDQFARDVQQAMGHETIHGFVCHLYINGLYWGLYHPGERPIADWASSHFGGEKEEWDSLNYGQARDGDRDAWNALKDIAGGGLSSPAAYENFRQYCDVENFVDYMIIMHYIGNQDWDNRNWYAVRRRAPGEGFKFIPWDSEGGLISLSDQKITGSQNNPNGPSTLFLRATENAEFRLLLADRLHKHFFNDGVLTPSGAAALWMKRAVVIDSVIAAESARWGDFRRDVLPSSPNVIYTPDSHYFPYQSTLLNDYFPARTGTVLEQYRDLDLYPTLAAPEFGQHGGQFTNSMVITVSGPAAIYYTLDGSDPREFGTGAILGVQYTGAISLTHSTRVKARCYDGSQWSALLEADFLDVSPSPLRLSEVMYAPRVPAGVETAVSDDSQAYAFIEIHNTSPSNTVGLVGVSFTGGVRFDFSRGTALSLPPGGHVVVVENPGAFAARYPSVPAGSIAGEFRGDLAGSGERLKLLVNGVGPVVSFGYSDGRGWPLAADGTGHSLIPLVFAGQSTGQLNYGGNWKASVYVDGSPGAVEPVPTAQIRLNEIIAHTDFDDPGFPGYDSNDQIELINSGPTAALLNGYYLSDDPLVLKKWAIPAGSSLLPGEIVSFDEISGFHSPITNGFGLDKAGEQVLLSFAAGDGPASVVDEVRFKGQENSRSLGRVPDGTGQWFVCLPTPGNGNLPAGQQPVISEIMYHPPSIEPGINNTADEFVEIYNPTVHDVNLWTMDEATVVGTWRLDGEADFGFPDNTVLPACGRVLVVSFDPTSSVDRAAFLDRYGLSEPISIYGPFDGRLSNEGGRIALEKPLAPDQPGDEKSWVIVDEVIYADAAPWMTSAAGAGNSLQRTLANGSGLDPQLWEADAPTPGWVATDPSDPALRIGQSGGQLKLRFNLQPGFNYLIEMKTNALSNAWLPYAKVSHPATEHDVDFPEDASPVFFRIGKED